MDAVCSLDMGPFEVGSMCPDCGHTGQAHPHGEGPDRGRVRECLLCRIEALEMLLEEK